MLESSILKKIASNYMYFFLAIIVIAFYFNQLETAIITLIGGLIVEFIFYLVVKNRGTNMKKIILKFMWVLREMDQMVHPILTIKLII